MVFLPPDFKEMMKYLSEEDHSLFLKTYEQTPVRSLRINSLKVSPDSLKNQLPFHLTPVPWVKEGFYYQPTKDNPGKHIYHDMGLYYIQEASAMAPVEALDPQPFDTILDLCAAPGGKTTQIAAKMKGQGLLIANEIDTVRSKALIENLDRFGVTNATVLNEKPATLKTAFKSYFDRILVDAPCSGEGMFRKDHESCKNWSLRLLDRCSDVQLDILHTAATLLRPGGRLVYSTCTFNKIENEETIGKFLEIHPDFHLRDVDQAAFYKPGFDMEGKTARLWPHHLRGEGHFIAVLEKKETEEEKKTRNKRDHFERGEKLNSVNTFFLETLHHFRTDNVVLQNEHVYLHHHNLPSVKGLRVKRIGRYLGTAKKGYFVPSHALALSLDPSNVRQVLNVHLDSPDLQRYLTGETLPLPSRLQKGWVLVTVNHFSLGWGKVSEGMIKNHYPKSLRWHKNWFNT